MLSRCAELGFMGFKDYRILFSVLKKVYYLYFTNPNYDVICFEVKSRVYKVYVNNVATMQL